MAHLRQLIESRPFFSRVPDQSLLSSDSGRAPTTCKHARRRLSFVYSASGKPFTLNMGKISGAQVTGYWYSPRDGTHVTAGTFANQATRSSCRQVTGAATIGFWCWTMHHESLHRPESAATCSRCATGTAPTKRAIAGSHKFDGNSHCFRCGWQNPTY
jgi:hypothetical protein